MHITARRSSTWLAIGLLLCAAGSSPLCAAEIDEVPVPGLKTKPVEAQWEYSADGKTWGAKPPAGAPANAQNGIAPMAFRGTFDVADPQAVAGLWVRIVAEQPGTPAKSAICTGDLAAASGGYWKDLGFCPTLLNAKAVLNGKPVPTTVMPMLYFWLPLQGALNKGKNTIELSGDCYTYWGALPATAITAKLVAADPQPATIFNGPVLGDFGDGYFTVTCRTALPANVTLEATPTEPAGKPVTVASENKLWHRMKVQVPPGTKSVSYSLKSKLGTHETSRGPYSVNFPGAEFRFVAMGNLLSHPIQVERLRMMADRVIAMKPGLVVNTGNISEHGTWDYDWETRFFEPAGKMAATIPTLHTPGGRDYAGTVSEMLYTPADDGYSHNWSKAIGPVRFIGIDGNQLWKPGSETAVWLEKELAAAKEKYLFVLDSQAGYSTGKHSRKPHAWSTHSRNDVMPLLGKFKANAMLSGNDPNYERCEPTPDKGCTQIVIGCSGKDAYRFSGSAMSNNPFFKGKGHDWAGAEQTRGICVFDLKENAVEMKFLQMPDDPKVVNEADFKVLDKKTFSPRQ
ncbi:MAG: hypothetical protein K8T91_10550 [Planctomycetes bacterium]|nr:hypothetical protein [Planctomycetota bacterium]